jgi:hypothetical protein
MDGTEITHLETDSCNLLFADIVIVVDDIGQRTAFHELHHDPQLKSLLLKECVKEVDNIVMA